MHNKYTSSTRRTSMSRRRSLLKPIQLRALHGLGYTSPDALSPEDAAALRALFLPGRGPRKS